MPVSTSARRFVVFTPLLLVLGCGDASSSADPTDEDESAVTAACSGGACASLPLPAPLSRGGIAIGGSKLSWIASGSLKAEYNQPGDELRQCVLPNCTTATRLPLVGTDGQPIRVDRGLQSAAGGVLFMAHLLEPYRYQLYRTVGQTLRPVGPAMGTQFDFYVGDESGVLIYKRGSAGVTSCTFAASGPTDPCVTVGDRTFGHSTNMALTPTRAYVGGLEGEIVSFDRATMSDRRVENWPSGYVRTGLLSVGEDVFDTAIGVTSRGGRAVHDTGVSSHDGFAAPRGHFHVPGVMTAHTSDGARLYVGTVGERDVSNPAGEGVVARFRPGNKSASTLAKKQDVAAIAVDASKVYWLDVANPSADEPVGVVRFAAK